MCLSLKISRVLVAATALLVGGCGGASEAPVAPPVVVVPPVVVPRVWSAPQAGPIAFEGANLTASPDSCGGITLFGIHESIWKRQRYSPTTGWETFAQPIFDSTKGDALQVLDTLPVPTFFYRLTEALESTPNWHQLSYRCEKNEWWGGTPFPVEYFPATNTSAPPVAIPVRFSRTFDDQILAASFLGDRSAIKLRVLKYAIWEPQMLSTVTVAPLIEQNADNPALRFAVSVDAVRNATGDSASITTAFGNVIAFRPSTGGSFVQMNATPTFCPTNRCAFSKQSFGWLRLEPSGDATVIQSGNLFDPSASWFRLTSSAGFSAITALPSFGTSNRGITQMLRSDGSAVWLLAGANLSALQIVENGVPASWSGTTDAEAVTFQPSTNATFSWPDGGYLVTLRSASQTGSGRPRFSISSRISSAAWARTYTLDLTDLYAQFPGAQVDGATIIAYRESLDRSWFVGALTVANATGGPTYRPFLLWR